MFAPFTSLTMKNRLLALVSVLSLVAAFLLPGCATPKKTGAYRSPDDAVASLVKAVRSGSKDEMVKALGPGSEDIISSGDPVADAATARKFLELYDKHHELRNDANGDITLLAGEESWPFPVPLVKGDEGWTFDVAAGKEEILARRIGRDEENAMHTCMAIVDAQRDYAELQAGSGGLPEYAQKVISDEGKRNGLYWKVGDGEKPSPLGPLVAGAADEGYKATKAGEAPAPYHGYYYRILRSQGPEAPGGARDYLVGGKMIGGFAVLAYPAQYGNSGIMTFMVNYDGVLYESDLGADTAKTAAQITSYDPGPKWKVTRTDDTDEDKPQPK